MIPAKINRLSKNIIYNVLASIVTFGVNFALLPFIVSHVGKEIYGIFTLIMVITGYLGLFDFGLTGAVVKYVAEYSCKKEYDKISDVISASLSFLFIVGIISATLLIITSLWFDLIFKVTESNRVMVKELLWVSGLASILIWPGKSFEAALQGFQFYGWLAINNVVSSILMGLSAYVIFAKGFSIVHYITAYYMIVVMKYIVCYAIVGQKLAGNKIRLFHYPNVMLKNLLGFGSYLFYGALINVIILQFDNVVIGAFLSVSAVTIYAVVYYMQNIFRVANGLISGPLFPYYAEMHGQGGDEEQQVFFLRGTKLISLIFVSMVVITIIFARPIIMTWMGEGFEESILPAQILISFWIFNGTLEVGTGMVTAKGFVKIPFFIGFINAVCNLALSLILVRYLGIIGVVMGTTIPMILINFPLLVQQINKVIGTGIREYINYAISKNLVIYVYGGLLSYVAQKLIYPHKFSMVIGEIAIIYLITILTGYLLIFTDKEKENVRSIVKYCLGRNV